MRAASDMRKLYDAIRRRLARLRRGFISIPARPIEDRNFVVSTCVIELDNMSMSAVREFTISTLSKARTLSGHRVNINKTFNGETEISAFLLRELNYVGFVNAGSPIAIDRKREPKMRDPKNTERILVACNATNLPSVQRALALNVGIFRDLGTVRNFYAHRNLDTFKKVRDKASNMGVLGVRHTDELVQGIAIGRQVTVFEDWIGEAEIFFEELMK